jgi:hypothetical protein
MACAMLFLVRLAAGCQATTDVVRIRDVCGFVVVSVARARARSFDAPWQVLIDEALTGSVQETIASEVIW